VTCVYLSQITAVSLGTSKCQRSEVELWWHWTLRSQLV